MRTRLRKQFAKDCVTSVSKAHLKRPVSCVIFVCFENVVKFTISIYMGRMS